MNGKTQHFVCVSPSVTSRTPVWEPLLEWKQVHIIYCTIMKTGDWLS